MKRGLRIILADGDQVPILLFHLDAGRERRIQLALRTLNEHRIAINFDRDAFRNRDRLFSNS